MEIVKLKGYKNIYAVDSFYSEYRELFGKSDNLYKKYLKKLRYNLDILDRETRKAIHYKQFERLENSRLCSIRDVSKINPRVVYAYIDDDERVVLLCSFKEKNKSDYTLGIKQAEQRLKQLEGEI